MPTQSPTEQTLLAENAELRARLEEAEETLHAIRSGEVDALVVDSSAGTQVFTLQGLDAELNRFRGEILEQVNDAIIVLDDGQHIAYLNTAAAHQYTVTASQALGCHVTKIYQNRWLHPGDEAAMMASLDETGRWRGENIHIKHNGEILHVESSVNRLNAGNGIHSGLLTVIRDITERKRTQEALRLSEQRYRSLFENNLDPIFSLTAEGKFFEANASAERASGYSLETLQTMHFLELCAPEERAESAEAFRQGLCRKCSDFETAMVRPDGKRVNLFLTGAPVIVDDEVVGVACIARDITERKHAEEALRESEKRLQLFIEHAPAGIAMFDRELRYLAASNRWKQDYGLSGDIIGRLHYEVFPDLPEHWKELNRRCLNGETLSADEDPYQRADGTTQWVKWEARPWLTAKKQVGGILIAAEEVTERVLAKMALHKSEAKLAAIVHQASAGLSETTLSGHFILVNDQFCTITGHNREELLALRWQDITHPDDLAENAAQFQLCVTEDRDFVVDKRYLRPDGSTIWVSNNVSLLRSDNGLPMGVVSVTFDIDERRKIEEKLLIQTEQLQDTDRRKDEFLAMLAHELRNPLAPIRNTVQLLRLMEPKNPGLNRANDMIERQVNHLVRLVDDLLDVSRVSRGNIQLQKEPVDLVAVARQAVEMSQPLIEGRRHELSMTLPPQTVLVEGDFTRLEQVVSNLLNNAAKYTDEGGTIWLTVEQTGGVAGSDAENEALIRVRDTGRGIDPSKLNNLFDMFYQVDHNLDRSYGGLGIGLSLVKSLVEMHGGRVEAHSAGHGNGSEFAVRLPCLPVEPPARHTEAPDVKTKSAHGHRILLVEDNLDVADSMAMLLTIYGHEMLMAYDGKQAVEMALRERPAVVLMDIGIPCLDGYEACRAMRNGGLTDSLIVAMTGYGQEEDIRNAEEAGFDRHMAKPVDPQALLKLLASLPE
ncbi:MAG: hybrid sensor histidine kinase/response regulator [Methylobacter sp.]